MVTILEIIHFWEPYVSYSLDWIQEQLESHFDSLLKFANNIIQISNNQNPKQRNINL
jgi:hypothetical protein